MTQPNQTREAKTPKNTPQKQKMTLQAEEKFGQPSSPDNFPEQAIFNGDLEGQVNPLDRPNLPSVQRQELAAQISNFQGNSHLQRLINAIQQPKLTPNHKVNLKKPIPNTSLVQSQADNLAPSVGLRPPPKGSIPTPERIEALRQWLTAHVAGHALATNPYTFYEVIDEYLGPWGNQGYPIAYGKRYNILFTNNEALMTNSTTQRWVWNTTIRLQDALVDFIVSRYSNGALGRLSEAELRQAAFASHPVAYTEGGLATVAIVAPSLIPEIASIPAVEFLPSAENFEASVIQVITTVDMTIPRVLGDLIAAITPASTGMYTIAVDRDHRAYIAQIRLSQYLRQLRQDIASRRVDSITLLEQITLQIYDQQFPNQGLVRAAYQVVTIANQRKGELARQYAAAIRDNPELQPIYDRTQPGWQEWLTK